MWTSIGLETVLGLICFLTSCALTNRSCVHCVAQSTLVSCPYRYAKKIAVAQCLNALRANGMSARDSRQLPEFEPFAYLPFEGRTKFITYSFMPWLLVQSVHVSFYYPSFTWHWLSKFGLNRHRRKCTLLMRFVMKTVQHCKDGFSDS